MGINIQDQLDAGLYTDAAVSTALRVLWQERPNVRIDVAVNQYVTESISAARTAAIAGVTISSMKEILTDHEIVLRLGPEAVEKAQAEVETLQSIRR